MGYIMVKYRASDIVQGKRVLANGMLAGYVMVDGKLAWRIIGSAAGKKNKDLREKNARKAKGKKEISPRSAKIAFNKYYKNKPYKTEAARKAAITRDNCSDNKMVTNSTNYRRSPHKYDYPGL